jgi:surface protein
MANNAIIPVKNYKIKNINKEKNNKTIKIKINKNKNLTQNIRNINNLNNMNMTNNSITNNNKSKIKFNSDISNRTHNINYLIIFILLFNFCKIYSIKENIILYSYEITLKVKDTGRKNILSTSFFMQPSNIYLNNELIRDIDDFHYINIIESDTIIKIGWINTVFNSISGMFSNCVDITEIDMTKFDTSSIIDMSNVFSSCSSLKSLNVSNLITTNVQTMQNMFYQCTEITSVNLESFTIPSITSLNRVFYGCTKLEYINLKNFEEKLSPTTGDMFTNIVKNAVICLDSSKSQNVYQQASLI